MPLPKKTPFSKIVQHKDTEHAVILANRYKVLRKLGSGSFGTVFLVADIRENEELKVLKEIPVGEILPDETISAVNEARLLAKLEHPGIVKFHDSFIDGECFCIVTEYCEGGDLDDKLHSWKKNGKDVDIQLVMTWFIQILLAVQYMHQRRVLHRDLKTRNIFLKNNMIKIGDFGISRILIGTADIATTFTGTPYFMAPEILKHEGYNSKSDIWSVGVILYEMCTLKRAFQGNNLMSIMFKIVEGDAPQLPSKMGNDLQQIYSHMLSKDPVWRLSASEILRKPFIKDHLEKLKSEMTNSVAPDRSLVRREAAEIAKIFTKPKKKKQFLNNNKVDSNRPKTPKEQLKLRKQQKADQEAERLKKITVSSYTESRRKYSHLKTRDSKVHLPFAFTKGIVSEQDKEGKKDFNGSVNGDEDSLLSVLELEHFDDKSDLDEQGKDQKNVLENIRKYTNCFGEDEDETEMFPSRIPQRDYTHCFGEDVSSDEEQEDGVFEEDSLNTGSLDLTSVSDIPEDASLADTYYSTYDDFEDASSDTESDDEETETTEDCDALVQYMENALDMADGEADSTFGDGTNSFGCSTTMRQQKIEALKRECTRLLGADGFLRAYRYLKKVRFESQSTTSEGVIMGHLKKLVGNSRDCFLVDQLLFLEKQNQITQESLECT